MQSLQLAHLFCEGEVCDLSLWVWLFSVFWCFVFLCALTMTLSLFPGGFQAIRGDVKRLAVSWRRWPDLITNCVNRRLRLHCVWWGSYPLCNFTLLLALRWHSLLCFCGLLEWRFLCFCEGLETTLHAVYTLHAVPSLPRTANLHSGTN
jgi:hypothetical protein